MFGAVTGMGFRVAWSNISPAWKNPAENVMEPVLAPDVRESGVGGEVAREMGRPWHSL